jgi:hypothetical protein
MVKKACSTFVAFFADVSKKGMANWSANSYNIKRVKNDCETVGESWTDLRNRILHDLLTGQVRLVTHQKFVYAF